MFNILCIALGVVSGLVGVGVLSFRLWVVASVRKRFDSVDARTRQGGKDDVDQAWVPTLAAITVVGVGMCLFAIVALSVGLTVHT